MKKISTLALFTLAFFTSKAQFTANFDQNIIAGGTCWTFIQISWTNEASDVISGTGSAYSNPPVTGSSTRDIITPALNIINTNLSVSFDYKLSNKLNGNATRLIEIGILTPSNNYTALGSFVLDKNSPTTVQNYSNTFSVSAGLHKIVFKFGGGTGDGNTRVIFDNLSISANAQYASPTYCNTAPVANNDNFIGIIGNQVFGNVLLNDNDVDGETMTPSIVTNSLDGIVVLNNNGTFSFTPNINFTGTTTTFTYRVNDNGFAPMNSNVATVTINLATAGSLPVTITSFNANLKNSKVDLNWTTVDERNFSHFEVEKSFNGTEYNTAAVVFAAGNTNTKMNYTHKDDVSMISKGLVYYRLKMIDSDGSFKYSEIRVIRIGGQVQTLNIMTYPNPVISDVRVTIPAEWQNKTVIYQIFNSAGQVVMSRTNSSASQTEVFNMSNLGIGFYIVKASNGTEAAQQKIIKK